MFRISAVDGSARIAMLSTLHGTIETPFFMPVATKAAAKHLSTMELEQAGSKALICNSFLLSLRPGVQLIKKCGGLHNFMGWDRVIFTDSGGFQFPSEKFFKKSTENSAFFKSPFDGKTHELSPENAISIQEGLGSDVMMCLDEMPLYGLSRQQVLSATLRTHSWARRCLDARRKKKHLLFGICQGGTFPDLRKKSAVFMSSLGFDGISIGGLAVGEPIPRMYKALESCLPFLPEDKPRYLMGVGSPEDLVRCVSMGVDMFDSAFPTQNARHGTLFTSSGKLRITNASCRNNMKPVDNACGCYLCAHFSRAYLHHLFRMNESLGLRLASLHNIFFINTLMAGLKESIRNNILEKYKKNFLKNYLT